MDESFHVLEAVQTRDAQIEAHAKQDLLGDLEPVVEDMTAVSCKMVFEDNWKPSLATIVAVVQS